MDPSDLVAQKYTAAGWKVIPSKGGVNDFIANLNAHVHFVQIRVKGSSDARYTGQGLNDFVQNAFSNGAVPVHACVDKTQVTLYDVNEDKRILLVGEKKVTAQTVPMPEPPAETKRAVKAKAPASADAEPSKPKTAPKAKAPASADAEPSKPKTVSKAKQSQDAEPKPTKQAAKTKTQTDAPAKAPPKRASAKATK